MRTEALCTLGVLEKMKMYKENAKKELLAIVGGVTASTHHLCTYTLQCINGIILSIYLLHSSAANNMSVCTLNLYANVIFTFITHSPLQH